MLKQTEEQTLKAITHRNSQEGKERQQTRRLYYSFYPVASSLRDACSSHQVLASKEGRQRPHNCHTV